MSSLETFSAHLCPKICWEGSKLGGGDSLINIVVAGCSMGLENQSTKDQL